MTPIWTPPRTWATGELVTAALLNAHLRDNLEFLKTPPTGAYTLNETADYTTTSTAFVDVDAARLALTLVTAGGDVLVGFTGTFGRSGVTLLIYLDVEVDGARLAGDDGLLFEQFGTGGANDKVLHFVALKRGLPAGSHTFKLQWRVNTGLATLYAGAGTLNKDVHPQFWAREVS